MVMTINSYKTKLRVASVIFSETILNDYVAKLQFLWDISGFSDRQKTRYVAESATWLHFYFLNCFEFHNQKGNTMYRSKLLQKQLNLRKCNSFCGIYYCLWNLLERKKSIGMVKLSCCGILNSTRSPYLICGFSYIFSTIFKKIFYINYFFCGWSARLSQNSMSNTDNSLNSPAKSQILK